MPEPRGISIRFVGGPHDGVTEFFYGNLPRTVEREGALYYLEYNGVGLYRFHGFVAHDVSRQWNRLMQALGKMLPRAINRSAAARRRARRLLR